MSRLLFAIIIVVSLVSCVTTKLRVTDMDSKENERRPAQANEVGEVKPTGCVTSSVGIGHESDSELPTEALDTNKFTVVYSEQTINKCPIKIGLTNLDSNSTRYYNLSYDNPSQSKCTYTAIVRSRDKDFKKSILYWEYKVTCRMSR